MPYGELLLRKGTWDQLQAQRAYVSGETLPEHAERPPSLDRKI